MFNAIKQNMLTKNKRREISAEEFFFLNFGPGKKQILKSKNSQNGFNSRMRLQRKGNMKIEQ